MLHTNFNSIGPDIYYTLTSTSHIISLLLDVKLSKIVLRVLNYNPNQFT